MKLNKIPHLKDYYSDSSCHFGYTGGMIFIGEYRYEEQAIRDLLKCIDQIKDDKNILGDSKD